MTITDKIPPIHPGEVLMEDFINGFGITNLQSHYELDRAEDLAGEQIASITPLGVA